MAISGRLMKCWEFNKCGSDKDKSCVTVLQNAGRTCWLVAGTLNGGKTECKKAAKVVTCKACDFYMGVKSGSL